ncbi:BMP family lipoprotein [Actinoplanes flavus]|uniref:BMP family ABC transporter substrate-binding protein n=1 Tax=Actinoplanes flavus TaxID=2820290 RepID=A0ABS3UF64_9ACTN|nr:BMP family ABC transporter substrate-binding protein [Actinoplanes flavus]MBO3737400.1 BMP family ABC transporter substrate-binding protein [Actinoplanes flavus]
MRQRIVAFVLTAAVAVLYGCAAEPVTVSTSGMTALGRETIHVGIAYDSAGRGDNSFNDMAAAGLDRAKKELLIDATEVTAQAETDEGRSASLRELVKAGSNPVIAVGFLYAGAVGTVSKENPDTLFAIIDDASVTADNVVSLLFAEQEGSYLVGVAAAMASRSDHIGFVGGVQVPLIEKFEAGYAAGARSVDSDIRIDTRYLTRPPDFSGFGSPEKGKAAAADLLGSGADVIYSAAGGSGSGSFEAVRAKPGAWAIGVDSDQYLTAPAAIQPRILTSMLKRVDNAVFQEIQAYIKGDRTGGVKQYDLKVDGVGYATSNAAVKKYEPRLERARFAILSGAVKVPTS